VILLGGPRIDRDPSEGMIDIEAFMALSVQDRRRHITDLSENDIIALELPAAEWLQLTNANLTHVLRTRRARGYSGLDKERLVSCDYLGSPPPHRSLRITQVALILSHVVPDKPDLASALRATMLSASFLPQIKAGELRRTLAIGKYNERAVLVRLRAFTNCTRLIIAGADHMRDFVLCVADVTEVGLLARRDNSFLVTSPDGIARLVILRRADSHGQRFEVPGEASSFTRLASECVSKCGRYRPGEPPQCCILSEVTRSESYRSVDVLTRLYQVAVPVEVKTATVKSTSLEYSRRCQVRLESSFLGEHCSDCELRRY
jgi:hypothetical protein